MHRLTRYDLPSSMNEDPRLAAPGEGGRANEWWLLSEATLRVAARMLPLRAATAFGAAAVVLAQSPLDVPRYMFLAPLVAFCGWALDVQLGRELEALELRLAGLGSRSVGASGQAEGGAASGVLEHWFETRRALFYGTVMTLGAAIAVDAQRFTPGEAIAEILWYATVAVGALLVLSLIAWNWWTDRFGEGALRTPQVVAAPAFSAAPLASVAAPVRMVDVSQGPVAAPAAVVLDRLALTGAGAAQETSPGPFPPGHGRVGGGEALPSEVRVSSVPAVVLASDDAPRPSVSTAAFGTVSLEAVESHGEAGQGDAAR